VWDEASLYTVVNRWVDKPQTKYYLKHQGDTQRAKGTKHSSVEHVFFELELVEGGEVDLEFLI